MRVTDAVRFTNDQIKAVLIFTDFPSIAPGAVFYGEKDREAGTDTFHAVQVNPSTNRHGEMTFDAPTAKMQGKLRFTPEYLIFNGWAYYQQSELFTGELAMFNPSAIDRSAYPSYKSEYLVKGKNDGIIVYTISPPTGHYDKFVVFIGSDATGGTLYEVMQFDEYERFRGNDVAHIIIHEELARLIGLKAGKYTIALGDGTWDELAASDYDITVNGAEVVIRRKD